MDMLVEGEKASETKGPVSPLFDVFLSTLLIFLSDGPKSVADIAETYDLVDTQVQRWLSLGEHSGLIEQADGQAWSVLRHSRVGNAIRSR